MNNEAQAWLEGRGCPEHVVRRGTEGLVHAWELTSRELAEGWEVDFDDYLNDLDDRQILFEMEGHGLLTPAEVKRVQLADHSFKASTEQSSDSVWGRDNATTHGWNPETNWWYWRKPKS